MTKKKPKRYTGFQEATTVINNLKNGGVKMKSIVSLAMAFGVLGTAYAGLIDNGVDYGKTRADFNMSISSYTATAIVDSLTGQQMAAIDFVNHGPYDVWIASYPSFDTSGSTCRLLHSSETYRIDGENGSTIYGQTLKGTSNVSKIDGTILKD